MSHNMVKKVVELQERLYFSFHWVSTERVKIVPLYPPSYTQTVDQIIDLETKVCISLFC